MSDSAQSSLPSPAPKKRRGPGRPFAKGPCDLVGRPRGGRAPRPVEERYREMTIAKVPLEAWGRIVERAVKQAEQGDDVARAWLSKQLGTDAPQRVEQKVDTTVNERRLVLESLSPEGQRLATELAVHLYSPKT